MKSFEYLTNSFWTRLKDGNIASLNNYKNVENVLFNEEYNISDLLTLLSITEDKHLDILLQKSEAITRQRFGKKISIYAPLYISNYCNNQCVYCGFNKTVKTERINLSIEQIVQEAKYLRNKGIRQLLIVSGEAVNSIDEYVKVASSLNHDFDFLAYEIEPLKISEYALLYNSGLDGVTIYQETYNEKLYSDYHPKGNKRDYRYRIETPERIAQANIPNITIGALLGLSDYKEEMLFLAGHLDYLIKKYWNINFAISFPRINTNNINFSAKYPVSDFDFVKIIASFRILFPDTPIYLSTRESPSLRDHMINYGVTNISAGSKTDPGGYALFKDKLEQFSTSDKRGIEEIIDYMKKNNLRPVLKDWDKGYRIKR
ncbi:MAG: 2-iminoacetate synthase ThiH [Pseudomonadota bacterium]